MTTQAARTVPAPRPAPPVPSRATDRRSAWTRLGVISALFAAAAGFAWLVTLPSIPLCMFKLWSGRPCPGCGMTRALVSLAHGDVPASLRYHPLGVPFAVGLGSLLAGAALGLVRGEDPVWRFVERRSVWIAVLGLGSFLVLWVVRAFLVPEWAPDPVRDAMFAR